MDEKLRDLLDKQDWEDIVGKLTLAACRQLKICGFTPDTSGNRAIPSANDPRGYALDAMVKAYEACETGTNMWNREFLLYPFLERLVCRLITDDQRKFSKKAGPSLSEIVLEPAIEDCPHTLLNEAYERANPELQIFILQVKDRVESDGGIHWENFKKELGLTKHSLNKLRNELAALLQRCGVEQPMTAKS